MSICYRVYKVLGSKCIRKFDNFEDAVNWVDKHDDFYNIEWSEPAFTFAGTYHHERRYCWNNIGREAYTVSY